MITPTPPVPADAEEAFLKWQRDHLLMRYDDREVWHAAVEWASRLAAELARQAAEQDERDNGVAATGAADGLAEKILALAHGLPGGTEGGGVAT